MKTKILFAFLFVNLMVYADAIFVYSIIDTVEFYHDGAWNPAYKTLALDTDDSLRLSEFASISLLPQGDDTPHPVQFKGTLSVQEALQQSTPVKQSIIGETFKGIWHEIYRPGNVSMDYYNAKRGATSRGTASEFAMAYAIENTVISDYDISFALVDANTLQIIESSVPENTHLILQVNNKSNTPLYVNLLDISQDGVSPVMPIDENGLMGHLLVPANATVRFSDLPMQFSLYGEGTDTIILLASSAPFDLAEVMELATHNQGAKTTTKIGICKKQVAIHVPN